MRVQSIRGCAHIKMTRDGESNDGIEKRTTEFDSLDGNAGGRVPVLYGARVSG